MSSIPLCLACGHADAERWAEAQDEEYFTINSRFTYYRCGSCGAVYIDPVPRDQLAIIYPHNYYSFDETVTNSLAFKAKDYLDQQFFKKFISRLPQKQINVLDIGGGNGRQLSSFKKVDPRIHRTVVVDLNSAATETARLYGHETFCGRFEDYQSTELLDVILMLNLIEHVDNPKELLVKAQRLLSPQGIVIIKTPNTDSLDARLFRHRNWGGYHCPRHWVLFNQQNFQAMLQGCGLKICHFKYTQGAPFWTTSVMFALNRKNWIRASREHPIPTHPLFPLFNIGFACLDLLRSTVSRTSQMLIILEQG